jgi:hypothetical protein
MRIHYDAEIDALKKRIPQADLKQLKSLVD